MDDTEEIVRAALHDILKNSLEQFRLVAGNELASKLVVEWNTRMRSTAGRAFWPEVRVELNPRLIQLSIAEVRRTLLHELAHLLAYHRSGRRRIAPHGIEWKQACIDLGIPGEKATHQLALPSVRQKRKWKYVCPQCGEGLERVRKMKRYVACYTCCKKYNRGQYDKRFELVKIDI